MLDPQSIAVSGIGYGARAVAVLGLWPESVVEEDAVSNYFGAGRKAEDDELIRQVVDKWETIERARREDTVVVQASIAHEHVEHFEPSSGDLAGHRIEMSPHERRLAFSAQRAARPVDVSSFTLAPDAAKAAIEAKRRNDNEALLLLLMDL